MAKIIFTFLCNFHVAKCVKIGLLFNYRKLMELMKSHFAYFFLNFEKVLAGTSKIEKIEE